MLRQPGMPPAVIELLERGRHALGRKRAELVAYVRRETERAAAHCNPACPCTEALRSLDEINTRVAAFGLDHGFAVADVHQVFSLARVETVRLMLQYVEFGTPRRREWSADEACGADEARRVAVERQAAAGELVDRLFTSDSPRLRGAYVRLATALEMQCAATTHTHVSTLDACAVEFAEAARVLNEVNPDRAAKLRVLLEMGLDPFRPAPGGQSVWQTALGARDAVLLGVLFPLHPVRPMWLTRRLPSALMVLAVEFT